MHIALFYIITKNSNAVKIIFGTWYKNIFPSVTMF